MIIEKMTQTIVKLKRNPLAKSFFNNGGCSKLIEFLNNEFISGESKKSLLIRIRVKYQIQKQEMMEDIQILDPFEFIDVYDQIDHVSLIHDNFNIDINGVRKMQDLDFLNKEANYFYALFTFNNEYDFNSFLSNIFTFHTYGYFSYEEVKNKIEQWITPKN